MNEDIKKYMPVNTNFANYIKVIFLDLGFQLTLFVRCAVFFRRMKLRLLAVFFDYLGALLTSCHVSSLAEIGRGIFFPHPACVVIGDGVVIGDDCTVYQQVTIGRQTKDNDDYPNIGNNVTIYSGAVLIGSIKVGDNAVIAANSVVTKDVKAGSVVAGVPAKVIKGTL